MPDEPAFNADYVLAEMAKGGGPIRVELIKDDGEVAQVRLRFGFDPLISKFLKQRFRAKWAPDSKCWIVFIPRGEGQYMLTRIMWFLRDMRAGKRPDAGAWIR